MSNSAGEILICERLGVPGCWQFPQGGVKKGETLEEALEREIDEELGLGKKHYRVLFGRGPYRYLFPPGRKKEGYDGQEQYYFKVILKRADAKISLDGDEPEFQALRWIPPAAYNLGWVAPMKRGVYAKVFTDFFGIFPRPARTWR